MGLIDFSLDNIGDLARDIRVAITGKEIEDPDKQAEIALKLEELEQAAKMGQIRVNEAEAKSRFLFVAGWRPFIGWVCGAALAYAFIVQPTVEWWAAIEHNNVNLPTIDAGVLFNLVLAMLGLGGLRTLEKVKNVQDRH